MKQVVIVVPKGKVNISSVAGTYEILNRANLFWQEMGHEPLMQIRIAGFVSEVTIATGIFSIHPVNIKHIKNANLVIIPAVNYDNNLLKENAILIEWIRKQYKSGAEIASICSGAFLLAATGLLNGRSCSTHWNLAERFKILYPNIDLQPDKLITADKGIYTNGGAFSFLHLILFLVEKYFDRSVAIHCSKVFQIDMDRTAQSPFFVFEAQKNHGDDLICEAQTYIEENLSERISFEALAFKLATSRRNFDRRFTKATGNTPVEYLQRVKVEVAKKTLEKGKKSIFEVMSDVGYSDDKAFREVFKRITGLSPLEYKAKYNKEVVAV